MPAWVRRVGILVVAITIVVMHHVVGAHQHSAGDETLTPGMGGVVAADTAGSTSRVLSGDSGAHLAAGAAVLHVHQSAQGDHDGASGSPLLQLYWAVLTAVLLLTALCLNTEVWRGRTAAPSRDRTAVGSTPRPVPLRLRLAHLQVLRL
jgi:hypothetical protein